MEAPGSLLRNARAGCGGAASRSRSTLSSTYHLPPVRDDRIAGLSVPEAGPFRSCRGPMKDAALLQGTAGRCGGSTGCSAGRKLGQRHRRGIHPRSPGDQTPLRTVADVIGPSHAEFHWKVLGPWDTEFDTRGSRGRRPATSRLGRPDVPSFIPRLGANSPHFGWDIDAKSPLNEPSPWRRHIAAVEEIALLAPATYDFECDKVSLFRYPSSAGFQCDV